MNRRKVGIAIFFSLTVVVSVSLLWEQAVLLSFTLITLAALKNYCAPFKNELRWFILIAVWGTLAEVLIMYFGGEPWVYSKPILLNIAMWTPLLWGFAATIFITLYEGVFAQK